MKGTLHFNTSLAQKLVLTLLNNEFVLKILNSTPFTRPLWVPGEQRLVANYTIEKGEEVQRLNIKIIFLIIEMRVELNACFFS